nr:mucin-4-like [Ciona intestinalis]|eukprot:XP_026696166.1 mucin-4-like [Ciona intestinalis]
MCVLGSTCINNPGSYTCQCPEGTFGDGITGCTNIDYCQGVDCVNGSCVNLPTSYECQCNSGWTKSPGGAVCDTDVLECTLDPSRCNNGQCIEQLGSFSCSCQAGWEGSACNTNINECSGNMNNCDGNATCTDTAGSFTCACNAGYRGDGLTCYEYILFLLPNPTTITNRNRNRRIRFDIPIPFGSEFFDSLFISENGVILFSRNNQNRVRNAEFATPIQNPSGNIRFIAPFWDNLAGGTLRFQLDQNSAGIGNTTCDLPRINDLIRNHLSINFTAKMVLRIEWDALTIFPPSLYPNSASTFQTIILSDGLKTIVLFAYQGGLMTYVPDSTQRTASNVGMGFYNNLGSQHYSTGNYFPHLGSNIGTNGLYLYLFDPGTTRETSCINWYNTQSLPWITPFRFSCPWTLFQMFRDRRWLYQFRADVFKQSYPSYFRRNSVCFQRTFGLIGSPAGPRCCYHTHSGAFLVGSHSHYELYQFPSFLPQSNYNASYNSYLNNEIIPYDNCCNAREDVFPYYCGLYEAVRPKTFSFLYRPQRFSWFFGDPHVVNLFNVEYTFNGLGEFYLIYLPSQFVLQGRTERAVNANGTQTEATFFTSFVARDTVNNYTVAFAPNQYNNDTVITINGQVKTFPAVGQSEAVGTLVLQQPNATQYYVGFSADIALTVFVVDGVISIQISSSTAFNTMARGLFGDFYFRNGTQLNVNDLKLNITGRDSFLTGSIDQEKVYPMGKSWQVNETESLFTYPDGRNYTFYNPSNHTPPFLTAEVAALNNATLQLYLSTCGRDNLACLYDYAVTRNQQLALASGNIANEARQLHTIASPS